MTDERDRNREEWSENREAKDFFKPPQEDPPDDPVPLDPPEETTNTETDDE